MCVKYKLNSISNINHYIWFYIVILEFIQILYKFFIYIGIGSPQPPDITPGGGFDPPHPPRIL